VIPPRANRSSPRDYDRQLYRARHLIENFFAKIKQFRAIATRYEKGQPDAMAKWMRRALVRTWVASRSSLRWIVCAAASAN
jgi:transposase